MTSEEIAKIWQALSEGAKSVAIYLTAAEPITGVEIDYFDIDEIAEGYVQELINSGLVEVKSRIQIAKEFVEQHPEGATTTDQNLWQNFRIERSIAEGKVDTVRYRFISAEVHNFVLTQFD